MCRQSTAWLLSKIALPAQILSKMTLSAQILSKMTLSARIFSKIARLSTTSAFFTHSLTSIHDPGNIWNWPLKHWNGLKHWKHWKGLKHWNEWNTEKGCKTRKRCLAWNKLVLPCWLLAVWIRRKYSEFLSFKKINLSQGVTSFNWGGGIFWRLIKIIFLLQPSQTLHKSGVTHNSQAKQ